MNRHDRPFVGMLAVTSTLMAAGTCLAQQEATNTSADAAADTSAAVSADATVVDKAATEKDPFHFSISPYIWLTGIDGDITVKDVTVNAAVDFADIVDAADKLFGLMGAVDIEYKGFVFQFNAAWSTMEFSGSKGTVENGTLSADIDMDTEWVEFFGGYRFMNRSMEKGVESTRRFTLDGFGGLRYTGMNVDATFKAETDLTLPDGEMISAGSSAERDQSESWFEPFIGGRMMFDLTDHLVLAIAGDIGGFGLAGADFAWQASALLGYEWHHEGWNIGLFGGYRALSQDYSTTGFAWDAVTHGPLLGMNISWAF